MRVFVTGGSGYIGNAVVAALRRTAAPMGAAPSLVAEADALYRAFKAGGSEEKG